MPNYRTRFAAESVIRLNKRAYFVPGEAESVSFDYPGWARVSIADRFSPVGTESMPNGFLIQVEMDVGTINEAIVASRDPAIAAVCFLSLGGRGSVSLPRVQWSYDVTPGVSDREWRGVLYDPRLNLAKRRTSVIALKEQWDKLDSFLARVDIKEDWKQRVMRAVHAYRRALADNEDSLSEFIVLWTALEGLDCVYRGVYPSRQSEFKDGMKRVLSQLDPNAPFEILEGLRNGVAHGVMDLSEAMRVASANMTLVRNALQFAVVQIIGFDEATSKALLTLPNIKGKFIPHYRVCGSLQFEPLPVGNFAGQPAVELVVGKITTERDGDKLQGNPDISFRFTGADARLTVIGTEFWGDKGLPMSVPGEIVNATVTKG